MVQSHPRGKQQTNSQPAHREVIPHKNAGERPKCTKPDQHEFFVGREISNRFLVHIIQEPERAQPHEDKADGFIAWEIARASGKALRIGEGVNLGN